VTVLTRMSVRQRTLARDLRRPRSSGVTWPQESRSQTDCVESAGMATVVANARLDLVLAGPIAILAAASTPQRVVAPRA
jgi:hypothetical protein